jgi:hypothetical protein
MTATLLIAFIIIVSAHAVSSFLPIAKIQQFSVQNKYHHNLSSLKSLSAPFGTSRTTLQQSTSNEENTTTLSKSEIILQEFHESKYTFRIVVIGNGAILETTSKLGPKNATSVSPKTGDKLMTFASEDASFEFHVKVDQVCMVTFVSTERPDGAGGTKVMRVSRFLNEKGTPICSLILADSSEGAVKWFEGMVEKYGQEAIM